jgi:transcriptional regulator with XRE-family HTH domain
MKVNAAVILEQRLRRAWTQEELAIASGLSHRTIQRLEKEASGSLESKKAIAAALDIDICDLDYEESPTMKKYKYKTVEMPIKHGFISTKTPDIESLLNAEGDQGWRLQEIIMPSVAGGRNDHMVIIFERVTE